MGEYTHTKGFDGFCNENVSVLDVPFIAFSAGSEEKKIVRDLTVKLFNLINI